MQCSTGFRDREIFPNFADLPNTGSFHGSLDKSANTNQPPKHWCFLGEITGFTSVVHRVLELVDLEDKKLQLHFYTDQRGREVDADKLRIGHTVAVLYAQRHGFVHGAHGIRHENPKLLKVRAPR